MGITGTASGPATSRGYADVHVTGRRIVAAIVDGLLIGAAYGAFAATFGSVGTAGAATHWTATVSPFGGLTYGLFVGAYYVLMEGLIGQTVGKMLVGIRVIGEATGRPPGISGAILRTLLRLVDGLFGYLLGYLVVLASPKRQRLGDMAAHTLVVRA